MLRLFRITTRGLGFTKDRRQEFSIVVACMSINEKDAVKLARAAYCPDWWEDHIITGVEYVGELNAAEGFQVPQEDID